MRKVEVCPYNKKWSLQFTEEAVKILNIFQEEITAIHHIGSTAVPGLKAKPVIDTMPVVKDIGMVEQYYTEMEGLGYEPKGEHGILGRRFFMKGGTQRTHHVHFFEEGSDHIERHVAFRDYLREHPDAKQKYGDLKESLAKQFPYDMEAYINGKASLVKEIEAKALKWQAKQGSAL
ncbi:GrpB family protein [Virgibacillus kimchii]